MKASTKWIVGLLGIGLIAATTYFWPGRQSAVLQGALRESQGLREQLCGRWEWRRTVDAYRGGTTLVPADSNREELTFREDGTYRRKDDAGQQLGRWAIDEAERKLAMIDGARASRAMFRASDFRHHIRKLTTDTLILAWQGRHGEVAELYQALPEDATLAPNP